MKAVKRRASLQALRFLALFAVITTSGGSVLYLIGLHVS